MMIVISICEWGVIIKNRQYIWNFDIPIRTEGTPPPSKKVSFLEDYIFSAMLYTSKTKGLQAKRNRRTKREKPSPIHRPTDHRCENKA